MPWNRRNEERRSYLRLGIRRATGSCQVAATSAVSRSVRRRRRDLAQLQPTKQNGDDDDDDDDAAPRSPRALARKIPVPCFHPALPVLFRVRRTRAVAELETFLERWSLTEIRRRKF